MTPDRRQSSPEYRERVAARVANIVERAFDDYDVALKWARRGSLEGPAAFDADVVALLTRRAATVAGLRPAVEA